jgi:hypothetical protein
MTADGRPLAVGGHDHLAASNPADGLAGEDGAGHNGRHD